MKDLKNISASVKQRLLNLAKKNKRPFNELLQYYAMERFLYRLSLSEHIDKFVLKGALMLRTLGMPDIRPTMDIDLLGKTKNIEKNISALITDILLIETPSDGLTFDKKSIKFENITEEADYTGLRVLFKAFLGNARINLQVDIGFGDTIYPGPVKNILPCLLNHPVTSLLCYSVESAIAEKFEAMVKLGSLNSRMKDFFDIWMLSNQYTMPQENLTQAIILTFKKRNTHLEKTLEAFSQEFIDSRKQMWLTYCKRLKLKHFPTDFKIIVSEIESFLAPIIDKILKMETNH